MGECKKRYIQVTLADLQNSEGCYIQAQPNNCAAVLDTLRQAVLYPAIGLQRDYVGFQLLNLNFFALKQPAACDQLRYLTNKCAAYAAGYLNRMFRIHLGKRI